MNSCLSVILVCSGLLFGKCLVAQGNDAREKQIVASVQRLLEMQEEDGAWPYEGVYRVRDVNGRRAIPVGYRIGGTAIVCTSLLYALEKPDRKLAKQMDAAITKATNLILSDLQHPRMKASTANRYDVRVWGHIFALDYFCRLKSQKRYSELTKKTNPWIEKLVKILVTEEIEGGGWNYANHRRHASFVTAPAVQALLLAKSTGAKVPEKIFERSAEILSKSRTDDGAFQYSGTASSRRAAKLPGSIARSAGCETTLMLLGKGNQKHLQSSIDAFHEHWNELEKRRQKSGTHLPPYNVAPYYFYYGHRYLAQAITQLPKEKQAKELEKFNKVLMKTRDKDNTWNDRVFARSKSFGTAMAILSLRTTKVPNPPSLKK